MEVYAIIIIVRDVVATDGVVAVAITEYYTKPVARDVVAGDVVAIGIPTEGYATFVVRDVVTGDVVAVGQPKIDAPFVV
jgi:hypothetical protein